MWNKHVKEKKTLQICPFCKQYFSRLQTHLAKMGPCRHRLTRSKRSRNKREFVKGLCTSSESKNHLPNVNNDLSNLFCEQSQNNITSEPTDVDVTSNSLSTIDLKNLTYELQEGNDKHPLSYKHVVSLELMQMLNKVRAPISLYNDIGRFILQNVSHIKRSHGSVVIPRDKLMKDMDQFISNKKKKHTKRTKNESKKRGWEYNLKPFIVDLQLMNSSYQIEVPQFDFVSAFMNIVYDPSITKDVSNLLYNDKDYLFPHNQHGYGVDDIHTGIWYKETHKNMILDANKEILCPIILFIDGVAIDSIGRMSLEPISFTLGWLSKKARNMKGSWRVLGYIPDVEKTLNIDYKSEFGTNKNVIKKIHYHQMIDSILSGLRQVQRNGGIEMELPFKQNNRKFIVKFPISFVIGDTIGNDKLCSRFQKYVPSLQQNTGVSRDCMCSYANSHLHNYKCCMLSRNTILNVTTNVARRLGFDKTVINAFDKMCFGSSKYGINGHTPPEMLHQWNLGVVTMLIKYFLEHLTTKCKDALNGIVINMANSVSQQSDRIMPNIRPFRIGIEKIKLTGKERLSQLFMIWITLLPSKHRQYLISIESTSSKKYRIYTNRYDNTKVRVKLDKILDTDTKYSKWLDIIQHTLSISQWLRSRDGEMKLEDLRPNHCVDLLVTNGFDEWQDYLMSSSNTENKSTKRVYDFEEVHRDIEHINKLGDINEDNPMYFTKHKQFNMILQQVNISTAEYGLRHYVRIFREVINDDDQEMLKNGKFHQLLHYVHYINMFGAPSNYDGSIPESMNKEFAKQTGKRTQQRYKTVNEQCAFRVYENNLIASSVSKSNKRMKSGITLKTVEEKLSQKMSGGRGKNVFSFDVDDRFWKRLNMKRTCFENLLKTRSDHILVNRKNATSDDNNESMNERISLVKAVVITLIKYDIISKDRMKNEMFRSLVNMITCFNYLRLNEDMKLNCRFNYYGYKNWMDWVLIDWGDQGGILPAKLLCIFDSTNIKKGCNYSFSQSLDNISPNWESLRSSDTWCLVHSVQENSQKTQTTKVHMSHVYRMDSDIQLVAVDSIIGSTYVISRDSYIDIIVKENLNVIEKLCVDLQENTEIIMISKQNTWSRLFMDNCDPFDKL